MTAIMQMLTFLGDHFYFVLIAFFEILAALALLVWPKCRRTAHAGAFLLPEEEQMLLQEIGRDASEVFLLMRRYDSMVLGAVGDVQALLGGSLQQLQDDVTAMYRNIKNPELGSRMERSYRAWRCEKPLEYELEMADGQWLHMSIAPCRNPAYELVHFHRSTAMHERERGYEQRLDKAEAASQFKTSFLFRMSHEIRTPMNGIIGMLTLMKGKIPADHAAMQYVEKAEELSDHMLSLINDILDMSRIEAGKVELENAPFSLRAFGKTLDDMFARQMEKKGVAFAVRYEELTADWVLGEPLPAQAGLGLQLFCAAHLEQRFTRLIIVSAGPYEQNLQLVQQYTGISVVCAAQQEQPVYTTLSPTCEMAVLPADLQSPEGFRVIC